MKYIKRFDTFLNEGEKVTIDRELKEYTLTHMSGDRFQLKSGDFFREFAVLPYKSETIGKLQKAHSNLSKAIESLNVDDLYSSIDSAEDIPYNYGNIYNSKYSLVEVPELISSIETDEQSMLSNSPKQFLLNNFSKLGKTIKDGVIISMEERAEVLCCVIEALFYYVRTVDKDHFYMGMNNDEIVEEYNEAIKTAAKESSFSFTGPFSDTKTESFSPDSSIIFWKCAKNMKEFFVRATVNPKDLYSEDNIGKTTGLKFSIVLQDEKVPQKNYSYFDIKELGARVKSFYDDVLNSKKLHETVINPEKTTLAEIQEHEDENGDIKTANIDVTYQIRFHGGDATLQSLEFKDNYGLELIGDDNPDWYEDMYNDGKTGQEVLDYFFEKDAQEYLMSKKLTINTFPFKLDGSYNANEGTDS